ncbi:MAG TPA: oligopeptide transporter, OPT family [Kofleriaceae bacterium]|nr:oligopeptide transporter, OPT family [Kofleriaceae bacterium]
MSEPSKTLAPHVPASRVLPEITAATLLLAIALSIVMAGANAYLGLFAGITVSASIPAAVVSMGLLRLIGGNILQNNGVQTAASAGESVAAGVIFTVPALVLLGAWDRFHFWETTLLAGLGGLLGVFFTIPLRRALIVEQPLRFPEGVATAEVLKLGEAGGGGLGRIAAATAIGGLFKLGATGLRLWHDTAAAASQVGGSIFYIGSNLSPALVGVGFIVGLNIAVLVFIGGALNWLVAIPIYSAVYGAPAVDGGAMAQAGEIWSGQTRYLGVGAMLVGGVWALIRLAPSLARGISAGLAAHRAAAGDPSGAAMQRTERDIPVQAVLLLSLACLLPLAVIFHRFSGSIGLAALMSLFVVVAGFLFSAVAAYMAGLVGSSNNPISGVTIATILVGSLLLKLLGTDSVLGPAAAIFIGAAVCCAAAIGGDNMQDLKAGHLLGATPWKQQVMQMVGVVAAVAFIAPILNLLHDAYGIGSRDLSAPQAGLMTSVAGGIFAGGLPWGMIAIGAGVAIAVICIDLVLEARGSSFRTPVLAVAVGIYLPFELSTPIFLGGLIAHLGARAMARAGAGPDEIVTGSRRGLLFSAGLITGEALMGIFLAIPIAIAEDTNVLAVTDGVPTALPGIVLLAILMSLLYRTSARRGSP